MIAPLPLSRAEQVRALLACLDSQTAAVEVVVRGAGQRHLFEIPPPAALPAVAPFAPTDFQTRILDALDGRALRTDALAGEVGDRRALFRHPGGLRELKEQGLVESHPRRGYFRPDAPPPELS